MRHYYGYDIDGNLVSVETYGPAGWPSNKCMEDPACQEDAVVSLRESRAKTSPEIVNWVLFDCPCDPGQGALLRDCACVSPKFAESYVDTSNKTLKTKPLRTVYVDGTPVQNGEVVTRAPGASVSLKVVAQGLEDGAMIRFIQKGLVDLTLDDEWELPIVNGETAVTTLVAPAQGTKGVVSVTGSKVRPLTFCVRGFATA